MLLFFFNFFFQSRKIQTVVLAEGNEGLLLGSTNNENIANSGGEGFSVGVFDMGDIEGSGVLVNGGQGSHTANIVSRLDVNSHTQLEGAHFGDLIFLQVQF